MSEHTKQPMASGLESVLGEEGEEDDDEDEDEEDEDDDEDEDEDEDEEDDEARRFFRDPS